MLPVAHQLRVHMVKKALHSKVTGMKHSVSPATTELAYVPSKQFTVFSV